MMTRLPLDTPYTISTCGEALTIVHRHEPLAKVEYFGSVVGCGSRNDPVGLDGLAHFVEHAIFKGTLRRRSRHILNRMESVGGELNAYTTKQHTVIYTAAPTGYAPRAIDLIGDLLCHSQFPLRELVKERQVVGDEIDSYRDIPAESVADDFDDLLFADTPLGHNILGHRKNLQHFTTEACSNFLRHNYTRQGMVLFYAGPMSLSRTTTLATRAFADLSMSTTTVKADPHVTDTTIFHKTEDKHRHQAHTVMGTKVCNMHSPMRHALSLLINMLGGPGMNSLLNVELREKRGLVYSVDSQVSFLPDTGVATIYFGCDHDDVLRCTRIINNAIASVANGCITPSALQRAKRQYIGQMAVASDSRESTIIAAARSVLHYGQITYAEQVRKAIDAVTLDLLAECAQAITPDQLSSLTYC